MTKAEWTKLAVLIQAKYPNVQLTETWIDAWYPTVEALSFEEGAAAVELYGQEGHAFAPNPGALVKIVRRGREPEAMEVMAELQRHSRYSGERCSDARLNAVARLLGGWKRLGLMDEDKWHFELPRIHEALDVIAMRERTTAGILPPPPEPVAGLPAGELPSKTYLQHVIEDINDLRGRWNAEEQA